jgi:protein O-GlcNAc transferase
VQEPNSAAPEPTFQHGLALHRQGRLADAAQVYREVLRRQPTHFDALHLLGIIAFQSNRPEVAVELIRAAISLNDTVAAAHNHLGIPLRRLGLLDEALASYDRAIALQPDFAEAHNNRGNALRDLGRTEQALASFDRAIALKPDYAEAHNNRGYALAVLARIEEALASFDQAIALRPDFAEAHNNRGNALRDLERIEAALASFDRVIALQPDFAEAHNNRGYVLARLMRIEDALASFDRAIALRPDYAEAHVNRGNALRDLARIEEALACFDRAIALQPDHADAHLNRGHALRDLGRIEDALTSFDRAVILAPDRAEVRFARCVAELPILYMNEPDIVVRRTAYERRLRELCGAGDDRADHARLAKGVGYSQPFYLPYQGYNDRNLQAMYGTFVCRIMAACYPPAAPAAPPTASEPVRVGFVSGFFREHSNWKLPIKGWLSQLDRRRFRVFGYHTAGREDSATKAAAAMCDRFVQGPLSVDRWRAEILADAPHVLIYPEVGMNDVAAMLAAQRLAAVQCNSWGHPETSGFPTLDYYLSSDLMEPPDAQDHYTERLVRLPNLSVYYEPADAPPASIERRDVGLRSTATVYWCCQSLYKYLPQFDEAFARIARAVGDCQFAFIQNAASHINGLFRQRLDRAFGALGLSVDDYCVFLPRLDWDGFIAATSQCHVFLDSIGWSGCNSTLESLSCDLPIVTMRAPLMRGRHSMAILHTMGVTETIAETIDDYVSIAVRLGLDAAWRSAVKARISTGKQRLYFDHACIAGLEQFLNTVVRGNA